MNGIWILKKVGGFFKGFQSQSLIYIMKRAAFAIKGKSDTRFPTFAWLSNFSRSFSPGKSINFALPSPLLNPFWYSNHAVAIAVLLRCFFAWSFRCIILLDSVLKNELGCHQFGTKADISSFCFSPPRAVLSIKSLGKRGPLILKN